jgi:hypothetical protein
VGGRGAIQLEFADESVLNLDAAVKQQEDMAFQLQQLGPAIAASSPACCSRSPMSGRVPMDAIISARCLEPSACHSCLRIVAWDELQAALAVGAWFSHHV